MSLHDNSLSPVTCANQKIGKHLPRSVEALSLFRWFTHVVMGVHRPTTLSPYITQSVLLGYQVNNNNKILSFFLTNQQKYLQHQIRRFYYILNFNSNYFCIVKEIRINVPKYTYIPCKRNFYNNLQTLLHSHSGQFYLLEVAFITLLLRLCRQDSISDTMFSTRRDVPGIIAI